MTDPFRSFAFDGELPLRQARADIIACHEMFGGTNELEPDVRDAIGHLIVDAYAKLDVILEKHTATSQAARKAGAA